MKIAFPPLLLLLLSVAWPAAAADAEKPDLSKLPPASAGKIDFKSQVLPIFTQHCVSCHDAKKFKGGLRVDQRSAFLRGGDGGKVLIPGDSAGSRIIHLVAGLDEDSIMPPKGKPLT